MNHGSSIGQFGRPSRSTCDIDWAPALRVSQPQLSILSLSGPRFSSLQSQGRCQSVRPSLLPSCLLLLGTTTPCAHAKCLGLVGPLSSRNPTLSTTCLPTHAAVVLDSSIIRGLTASLSSVSTSFALYLDWPSRSVSAPGARAEQNYRANQSLRRLHFASRPISTSASHGLVVKCLFLVTVASAVDRYRVWWDMKVEQALTSRSHRIKTLNLP
ncbi:hypothetical protein BDP81DRAFT_434870 [Colletotrichum phormii]|uniref:Uncharacterized protein n=1 Tax=Colletotrichum phormii TaxID=359342 RepID=A0AAI9ZKN1_9PEZI|nr:uncharacterized protein BDP81DRAFT_434870 [Colletotrichum phormii]KAK1633426.1 hypothetical protein BDP81DRAFT_434870 [Colletotrichum phormii]